MEPHEDMTREDRRSSKSTVEIVTINVISYLIFLGLAAFILWAQISHHAFIAGTDSTFHMNRFYEAAMQLKEDHFSYFQSLYSFHRTGRMVVALYGPMMAYLCGGLLLICKSWSNFQIVNSLLVLSLSGWLMYILSVKCHVKRWAGLVIGVMYMTSYCVGIWPTDQRSTGLGAAFLPIAMLCGMKMLHDHRIKVLPLALIMTLLVQTHIMTSVVAIAALVPLFIVGWCHSKNRSAMLLNGFKAAGLTIFLSGNVWGTVVDMFTTNHIIPVFPQQEPLLGTVNLNHGYLSFLGPVLTIVVLLVTCSLIFRWRTYDYQWKTVVFTGWLFLWLSSTWFPWEWVYRHWTPVTNAIQFPRRFLIIAIIMFLLAFGQSCSRRTSMAAWSFHGFKLRNVKYLLLVAFVIMAVTGLKLFVNSEVATYESSEVLNEPMGMVHVNRSLAPEQLRHVFTSDNFKAGIRDVTKSTPDYLPTSHDLKTDHDYFALHPYYQEFVQLDRPSLNVRHRIIGRDKLQVSWRNRRAYRREMIVPLAAYQQTQVTLNGRMLKHPKITQVGALKVPARSGVNHVTIEFHPDGSLRLMMIITSLAWLALFIYLGVHRRDNL